MRPRLSGLANGMTKLVRCSAAGLGFTAISQTIFAQNQPASRVPTRTECDLLQPSATGSGKVPISIPKIRNFARKTYRRRYFLPPLLAASSTRVRIEL